MTLQPQNPQEVQEIVQTHRRLQPFAGRSKPALSAPGPEATPLDMSRLTGLLEYEPGEFTFTALAATPVAEVSAELAKNGQYLPFDPLLAGQGATLGGTVAANTGGSGRFRYGGVRDFILGVRFVDGQGQLVRGGGKVVKNAAGFDLPKFMVGSLGRYGLLTEITFKVFPRPRAYVTLQVTCARLETALHATFKLANKPYELDALDLRPRDNGHVQLLLRLGGPPGALAGRVARLRDFLAAEIAILEASLAEGQADAALWAGINAVNWAKPGQALVKIPIAPKQLPALDSLPGVGARHYSAAGNVAWVTVADVPRLHTQLAEMGLAGLVLRGSVEQPLIGARPGLPLAQRVKQALDPHGKFLEA